MSKAVIPGDPPIELFLRRSARSRRISLRVGRLDGKVTLSLPTRGSLEEALAFARGKEDWIRNVLPKAQLPERALKIGGHLPYLGEDLLLVHGTERGVRRDGSALLIGGAAGRIGPALAGFLKANAQALLLEASTRHAASVGKSFRTMALRDTRSRWGSCAADGRLMYSWRLVMAPPAVLDYVAAHEVAHLVHMNHSPAFWQVVRGLCPDYTRHRDWLKREGNRLQMIDFHG